MVLVVVIALAGGHLLADPVQGDRGTLAFASAMRHPGIALALIGANHANRTISAGVLLFLLVGFIALIPYQMFLKRTAPKGAAASSAA
jgi:hypothetical protein